MAISQEEERHPHLARDIGLREATALNMIDMIGVGPFITMPLIVAAMGGPQAILGWVLGAFFAICDGLVWAELGAAMPRAGGSYQYLKECYGPGKLGRLMSFLFVWQLSFSAPLSIASGSIGVAQYATYLWPALGRTYFDHTFSAPVPLLEKFEMHISISNGTFLAMASCGLAVILLYRRIAIIGRLSKFLWVGAVGTVLWVIAAGMTHFSASRAFSFPPGAFHLSPAFFTGLGAAMLVAAYDYGGYFNVCFLGAEVREPERTIPRALIYSILLVAALYLAMNISILGVIPWQELQQAAGAGNNLFVASTLMQRTLGVWAGDVVAVLIIWTAFASVFSLMLGYSRVPYAAALDGNYFRQFGRIHPRLHFPHVSLLSLGIVAMFFCFFRLADVIAALVVIRISVQYLSQILGLLLLRASRPDFPRPFRMWLYPVPAVLAAIGFSYILFARKNFVKEIRFAAVIIALGLLIFLLRSWRRHEWPFSLAGAHKTGGA
ncbi:MAG TPA: APC family permease [Candidatus Angelobacter sp.]|nr:APC family permease [Candidatus Angelobacter sp.]